MTGSGSFVLYHGAHRSRRFYNGSSGAEMMQYRIQGIDAELEVLADDIGLNPTLRDDCKIEIRTVPGQSDDLLQQGVIVEMVISVTSGVLTTAVTEALRRLVQRTQDRGAVVVERPEPAHEHADREQPQ